MEGALQRVFYILMKMNIFLKANLVDSFFIMHNGDC